MHAVPQAVRRRYLLLLALTVAGAGVFQLINALTAGAGQAAVRPSAAISTAPTPAASTPAGIPGATTAIAAHANPPTENLRLKIRRGDNLANLFSDHGLSAADLHAMLALGQATRRLRQVRPGEVISVDYAAGRVLDLQMQIDDAHMLNVQRQADAYQARVTDIPTEFTTAYAHGVIENSLFDAATRAGLSDAVTMQLIHLFGWDIDFAHDIQSGDVFTVLYQKIHRQDQPIADGPILAAEFVTGGRTYRVVRYTDPNGQTGYYTPSGHSVKKALLRAPVDFTRISSGFSLHRLNPVLHYVRPHMGVDYAAPVGTPIKAAGDGRIVFSGWKNGYGRCMIIDHGDGYSTLYAHMSHFRRGLHAGSRVKQDQVIGYVGMTGIATGPHLHFEVRINGAPRNPRTVKLPDAAPILARYKADFDQRMAVLLAQLSSAGETRMASTAAGSSGSVNTAH
ncbi:MAG: peptidoglycan DD-metalloendopeptidase family protein [Gammaproteobacteria bacterium]|nr:peptidoglycan DD-metalloendopeptidase family protein [Gammaproteobacteria bacterium]